MRYLPPAGPPRSRSPHSPLLHVPTKQQQHRLSRLPLSVANICRWRSHAKDRRLWITGHCGHGASQQKINRLENLMTLCKNVHRYWDTGKIILEPVGDPLAIFNASNTCTSAAPILTHYDVVFSYPWSPRAQTL